MFLCFVLLWIVIIESAIALGESRFGWDLFAGMPNNDKSTHFGINLATGVAVYFILAYKARKIRIDKKIIPAKVRAHLQSGR